VALLVDLVFAGDLCLHGSRTRGVRAQCATQPNIPAH
jgi:hypothetical protein